MSNFEKISPQDKSKSEEDKQEELMAYYLQALNKKKKGDERGTQEWFDKAVGFDPNKLSPENKEDYESTVRALGFAEDLETKQEPETIKETVASREQIGKSRDSYIKNMGQFLNNMLEGGDRAKALQFLDAAKDDYDKYLALGGKEEINVGIKDAKDNEYKIPFSVFSKFYQDQKKILLQKIIKEQK